MKNERTDYERLLILSTMFIKESSTLKILVNNLCEEFNAVSESMYYMNEYQNKMLDILLNNFGLDSINFDCPQSFYHFMRYKKNKLD